MNYYNIHIKRQLVTMGDLYMDNQKNMITDCYGKPFNDINLANSFPEFQGCFDHKENKIDIWAYKIPSFNSQKVTILMPDDFRLVAGIKKFMQFKNSFGDIYQALSREEIIDYIDQGNTPTALGSYDPKTNEKLPPWMSATLCKIINFDSLVSD